MDEENSKLRHENIELKNRLDEIVGNLEGQNIELKKKNAELMEQIEAMKAEKSKEKIDENQIGDLQNSNKMKRLPYENEESCNLELKRIKLSSKEIPDANSHLPTSSRMLSNMPADSEKLLRGLPAELLNEIYALLPLENALCLLVKMANGILARNVRRKLNKLKMASKVVFINGNKWNLQNCGPNLIFTADRMLLVVEHSGPDRWSFVRAKKPIPLMNWHSKQPMIAYYEVKILKKSSICSGSIKIGFCTKQFPTRGEWLGNVENSIGIYSKQEMRIDGSHHYFGNGFGCFKAGDVIGIGIVNYPTNSPKIKCFATCNRKLLGMIKLPIKFATLKLIPAVNLHDMGDSIQLNDG